MDQVLRNEIKNLSVTTELTSWCDPDPKGDW